MSISKEDLENRFTYHAPTEEQIKRYERLRAEGMAFAKTICALTYPSREQSLAITHLEEAVMFANASIARNG